MAVKPVPDGHSSVIPYLVVPSVATLIDFLKKAFDAKEVHRSALPDGTVMHAHVRIGDSSIMMGQKPPGSDVGAGMLYLYVTDADAVYRRAIDAGATSISAPSNQFYGDRVGAVKDASGNQWWIATHVEDVADDEIARRMTKGKA